MWQPGLFTALRSEALTVLLAGSRAFWPTEHHQRSIVAAQLAMAAASRTQALPPTPAVLALSAGLLRLLASRPRVSVLAVPFEGSRGQPLGKPWLVLPSHGGQAAEWDASALTDDAGRALTELHPSASSVTKLSELTSMVRVSHSRPDPTSDSYP